MVGPGAGRLHAPEAEGTGGGGSTCKLVCKQKRAGPVQRMEQTRGEKQRAAGPARVRPGLRPPGTGSA